MKHIHAELMAQYAEDAMTTDKPWLLWMVKTDHLGWVCLNGNINWLSNHLYKRKSKTININGGEIPEPLRIKPEDGEMYFYSNTTRPTTYDSKHWGDDFEIDEHLFKSGLCHDNYKAASLHKLALLSFTSKDSK